MFDDGKQADGLILDALAAASGPMTSANVAEVTGLVLRRVQRRLHRLIQAGAVKKVGAGRYGLAAAHDAAGPSGQAPRKSWFWEEMQADSRQQDSQAEEVLIPEIVPSHQRPPRQEKVVVVADEADLFQKLRETFVTGFCDGGGFKQLAVHIADKQTRYFLAENQLLGHNKAKDTTISELYSFAFGMGEESRRQRLKEQRQAEQDALRREQAEQRRRDMAIRTKELEEQQQAERLVRQCLIELANSIKAGAFPYPILRKYSVPDEDHEAWISYAKKLIAR